MTWRNLPLYRQHHLKKNRSRGRIFDSNKKIFDSNEKNGSPRPSAPQNQRNDVKQQQDKESSTRVVLVDVQSL